MYYFHTPCLFICNHNYYESVNSLNMIMSRVAFYRYKKHIPGLSSDMSCLEIQPYKYSSTYRSYNRLSKTSVKPTIMIKIHSNTQTKTQTKANKSMILFFCDIICFIIIVIDNIITINIYLTPSVFNEL